MIKALENPHYKKIWEYVNWQVRHPEAKSLEEALEIESKNRLCFVTSPQWGYFKDSEGKSYRKDFDDELFTVGEYEIYSDSHVGGGFATILGRAITLEDVISILNHQPWENRGWIQSFGITETVNRGEYHIDIYDKDYTVVGLCFWQLTKPLHEQTHRTWAMLSEFIKTREHFLTVDELPSQTHGIN